MNPALIDIMFMRLDAVARIHEDLLQRLAALDGSTASDCAYTAACCRGLLQDLVTREEIERWRADIYPKTPGA